MLFNAATARSRYDAQVSKFTPLEWAQICRVEAMRTSDAPMRALLLDLALEYEALASGEADPINPDDPKIQNAVADRLMALALKKNGRPKAQS